MLQIMTIMFLSSMRLIDIQVKLTEFHLIGPKRNNVFEELF